MVTGFDLIHQQSLQEHWIRRLVAIIIDSLVIIIPLWLLTLFFKFKIFDLPSIFIFGLILWFYSAIFETAGNTTIGKIIMNLKLKGKGKDIDFSKTLIRNVSKIFFLILFLDWLVGMATEGDPRERFLDRIVNTKVVQPKEKIILKKITKIGEG